LHEFATQVVLGRRPTLPKSCPSDLVATLNSMWHAVPEKRPPVTEFGAWMVRFQNTATEQCARDKVSRVVQRRMGFD
jgi:hypothetical protein